MQLSPAEASWQPPPDEYVELLRACLYAEDRGRRAFAGFCDRVGDLKAYFGRNPDEVKALLPLLFRAADRGGWSLGGGVSTYLKTAYVREEARYDTMRRVCAAILRMLDTAAIRCAVLGGIILARRLYAPPFARHTAGLDLLLPSEDHRRRAARVLSEHGLEMVTGGASALVHEQVLRHRSGLSVALLTRPFPPVPPDALLDRLWDRTLVSSVDGATVRTLDDTEALFEIVGRAVHSQRQGLLWIADAWLVVGGSRALDWGPLAVLARDFGIAAPVARVLDFLRDVLCAAVPAELERSSSGRVGDRPRPAREPGSRQGAPYRLGEVLDFRLNGRGRQYAEFGWSTTEPGGTWSIGSEARLVLACDPVDCPAARLEAHLVPFLAERRPNLGVDVFVNDELVGEWRFSGCDLQPVERAMMISSAVLTKQAPVRIVFRIQAPCSPLEIGLSEDPRPLGVQLVSILLAPERRQLRPRTAIAPRRFPAEPMSVWPTPDQELLLRAAEAASEDAALTAWRAWRERNDPCDSDAASRRLLPLVWRRLSRRVLAPNDAAELRAIYEETHRRNLERLAVCSRIVEAFREERIDILMLKGVSLLPFYGNDLGLRAMSDIDILVPTRQAHAAVDRLGRLGYVFAPGMESESRRHAALSRVPSWGLRDKDGHEIDLHWHVLHASCQEDADEEFWDAASETEIEGVRVSVLAPTDLLFHVCVHGLRPDPIRSIRWIPDAMRILEAHVAIDWARLLRHARKRRLVLPLRRALGYLNRTWGAALPGWMLESLEAERVSWGDRIEFEGLLSGAGGLTALERFVLEYQRSRRCEERLDRPRSRLARLARTLPRHFHATRLSQLVLRTALDTVGLQVAPTARLARFLYRVADPEPEIVVGHEYRLGDPLDFSSEGDGALYLGAGWAQTERGGVWSDGAASRLVLRLDHVPCRDLIVEAVVARAFLNGRVPRMEIEVLANDARVGRWSFERSDDAGRRRAAIPCALAAAPRLVIDFRIRHPVSPAEIGLSADSRQLGIHLATLRITEV